MTDPLLPIVDSGSVELSLLTRLRAQLPTYLAEMDVTTPLPDGIKTNTPKSWEILPALDLSDEPSMPAIKIVAPGPIDPPKKDGSGLYRAVYELNVVAIVMSNNEPNTVALRNRYEAAIVSCVMQKRSLGDPNVRGTDYQGANKFDLPADERRSKLAVSCGFHIEYENVVNWKAGPPILITEVEPTPDDIPLSDLGVVRDWTTAPPYTPITLTKKES